MNNCQLCGQATDARSIFCPYCGQKIVREPIRLTYPVNIWQEVGEMIAASPLHHVASLSLWLGSGSSLRSVTLPDRSRFILGRLDLITRIAPDVDLTAFNAHNLGVSRVHAAIDDRPATPTLTDLDSRNGTDLNGQRLQPHLAYLLHDNDVICLGKLVLYVHI